MRVLIVDDYPGARYRRMRILLEDGGYQVAEEALGRAAVRPVEGEAFDLVVCDLQLQDISDLEVCRAIRKGANNASVPILMVSAVADAGQVASEAVAAGATRFIQDTPDAREFLSAVRQTLG